MTFWPHNSDQHCMHQLGGGYERMRRLPYMCFSISRPLPRLRGNVASARLRKKAYNKTWRHASFFADLFHPIPRLGIACFGIPSHPISKTPSLALSYFLLLSSRFAVLYPSSVAGEESTATRILAARLQPWAPTRAEAYLPCPAMAAAMFRTRSTSPGVTVCALRPRADIMG